MCEACGPLNPRPRTLAEQAIHDEVMTRFRHHLDRQLARQGTTVEAVLDSDCYGTRRQKTATWLKDMFFNFRVAIGCV
jgi:hypothetical protein